MSSGGKNGGGNKIRRAANAKSGEKASMGAANGEKAVAGARNGATGGSRAAGNAGAGRVKVKRGKLSDVRIKRGKLTDAHRGGGTSLRARSPRVTRQGATRTATQAAPRRAPKNSPEVWGLVLAAGASRRMGQQKLLLPLTEGKSLVGHVLETAAEAGLDGLLVVVGEHDTAVREETLDKRWQQVRNPHPERGMSSSLQAGISVLERSLADAVIVLLGDQPDVTAATIGSVKGRFEETLSPVVQASYRGIPSHPVLFARSVWRELMNVQGDEGGRSVVQAHKAKRVLVEVDAGVPVDLDTPEAYAGWMEHHHR